MGSSTCIDADRLNIAHSENGAPYEGSIQAVRLILFEMILRRKYYCWPAGIDGSSALRYELAQIAIYASIHRFKADEAYLQCDRVSADCGLPDTKVKERDVIHRRHFIRKCYFAVIVEDALSCQSHLGDALAIASLGQT